VSLRLAVVRARDCVVDGEDCAAANAQRGAAQVRRARRLHAHRGAHGHRLVHRHRRVHCRRRARTSVVRACRRRGVVEGEEAPNRLGHLRRLRERVEGLHRDLDHGSETTQAKQAKQVKQANTRREK